MRVHRRASCASEHRRPVGRYKLPTHINKLDKAMGASKQYQLRSRNKYIQLCEPQPQGLMNNAGLEVQLKAIQSSSYDLEAGLQTKVAA